MPQKLLLRHFAIDNHKMKRWFYILFPAVILLQACATSRNAFENPEVSWISEGNFRIEMQEVVSEEGKVNNAFGSYMAIYNDGTGTLDISPMLSSKRLDLLKLVNVPAKVDNIKPLNNGKIVFDITFCENIPLKEIIFTVTLFSKTKKCHIFSRYGYGKWNYFYINGTFTNLPNMAGGKII